MFKMTKNIVSLVIAGVILVGGYLLAAHSFGLWPFGSGKIEIDETPNVVTGIREMKQLTTACYYEDVDTLVTKTSDDPLMLFLDERDRIQLIMNGKVRAGYDFAKLDESQVKISGDTLKLKLPPVEILDTVCNPSDCEVFINEGNWPHEKVQSIQMDLKYKLVDHAREEHILDKAAKSGKVQLEKLFKSFGFKEVVFS